FEYLGKAAARLDDLLNLVPTRLAALALVAGAPLAADGRRALRTARRDHALTASPNAGWTMAAMAGALGVVLEKPGAYRLGEGRPPTAADIGVSLRVVAVAAAAAPTITAPERNGVRRPWRGAARKARPSAAPIHATGWQTFDGSPIPRSRRSAPTRITGNRTRSAAGRGGGVGAARRETAAGEA